MAHTKSEPTQMDTSLAVCEWSIGKDKYGKPNMQPQQSLYQTKGVGVYERVFFYIGNKEIKHDLAEIKSISNAPSKLIGPPDLLRMLTGVTVVLNVG